MGYGCGKCDGMCKISDRARPDRGQGQVTDRQVSSLLMTREREREVCGLVRSKPLGGGDRRDTGYTPPVNYPNQLRETKQLKTN